MSEVEEHLKLLKEKRESLKTLQKELYEERTKRDEMNTKVKMLSMKIKEKRNLLSSKINELKRLKERKREIIDKVRNVRAEERELSSKIAELKKLRREAKKKLRSLSSLIKGRKSEEQLKEELERLEWIYQTTPMSLEEEKEYVRRIDKIELILQIMKKCKEIRNEIDSATKTIDELSLRLSRLREERAELIERLNEIKSEISKKFEEMKSLREEISELISQRNSLKEEADQHHQNYVNILLKIGEVKEEIQRLELLIRAFRIAKNLKERKKKLKAKAAEVYERYKRGEKISWDEFKLLLEFGYIKSIQE